MNPLFDKYYYLSTNPDVALAKIDAYEHYVSNGEQEGRKPNFLFDPIHYKSQIDVSNENLLDHYLNNYASILANPHPFFMSRWYLEKYKISVNPLLHFLINYRAGFQPNPIFDPKYYLSTNKDLEKVSGNLAFHYLNTGYRERREVSKIFNSNFYINEYELKPEVDPVTHYLSIGRYRGYKFQPEKNGNLISELKSNEKVERKTSPNNVISAARKVKLIAFYLPQFHRIPENNRWWGEGFTEWRNVAKSYPRFQGHYQPRVPLDLGYYDLSHENSVNEQINLAKNFGISAFCIYYYRFGDKVLLNKPIQYFRKKKNFKFLICWANENWTRSWDGLTKDILEKFEYSEKVANSMLQDLASYINSGNYFEIEGKPLFLMYRSDNIENLEHEINKWRKYILEVTGKEILIMRVSNPFEPFNNNSKLFDAFVEFPPHNLELNLAAVKPRPKLYDYNFNGYIGDYTKLNNLASDARSKYDNKIIPSIMTGWDNTPRKKSAGTVFINSNPNEFRKWLKDSIIYATNNKINNTPLLFINAWNEWAEGTYLEPDEKFGSDYLIATSEENNLILNVDNSRLKILLVGHDASNNGAQILLLNIGRYLKKNYGVEIEYLILTDGPLVNAYEEVGRLYVTNDVDKIKNIIQNFSGVIYNTTVTGHLTQYSSNNNLPHLNLIHELPNIIKEKNLEKNLKNIYEKSNKVVLPSKYCLDSIFDEFKLESNSPIDIKFQGLYPPIDNNSDHSLDQLILKIKNIPNSKIVLGLGYGDYRKGFDIFLNTHKENFSSNQNIIFLWVGNLDAHSSKLLNSYKSESFFHIGFIKNPHSVIEASNLLFLSSREDPFPTIALESWSHGKPVVAFANTGGIPHYMTEHEDQNLGTVLRDGATLSETGKAIIQLLNDDLKIDKDQILSDFNFDGYLNYLYFTLFKSIPKISVIVPSYNYSEYIEDRLKNILLQTLAPFEIIVVDDASTDKSWELINKLSFEHPGRINCIRNPVNSGSVFANWLKGLKIAKGDYVWIAEADDLSQLNFLEKIGYRLKNDPNALICFSDSLSIDSDGVMVGKSYSNYINQYSSQMDYEKIDAKIFLKNHLAILNPILNVSSTLIDRNSLLEAFEKNYDEITKYKIAGDWIIYKFICDQNDGNIHFVNDSLNIHRRHKKSVTKSSQPVQNHLNEIMMAQKFRSPNYLFYKKQREKYLADMKLALLKE